MRTVYGGYCLVRAARLWRCWCIGGEWITRHILMERFFIAIKFSSLWAVCTVSLLSSCLSWCRRLIESRILRKNAQTAPESCGQGEWTVPVRKYILQRQTRPLRSSRWPVFVFFCFVQLAVHAIGRSCRALSPSVCALLTVDAPIVCRRSRLVTDDDTVASGTPASSSVYETRMGPSVAENVDGCVAQSLWSCLIFVFIFYKSRFIVTLM